MEEEGSRDAASTQHASAAPAFALPDDGAQQPSTTAATLLQAHFRSHKTRDDLALQSAWATYIQTVWRYRASAPVKHGIAAHSALEADLTSLLSKVFERCMPSGQADLPDGRRQSVEVHSGNRFESVDFSKAPLKDTVSQDTARRRQSLAIHSGKAFEDVDFGDDSIKHSVVDVDTDRRRQSLATHGGKVFENMDLDNFVAKTFVNVEHNRREEQHIKAAGKPDV